MIIINTLFNLHQTFTIKSMGNEDHIDNNNVCIWRLNTMMNTGLDQLGTVEHIYKDPLPRQEKGPI